MYNVPGKLHHHYLTIILLFCYWNNYHLTNETSRYELIGNFDKGGFLNQYVYIYDCSNFTFVENSE